MKQYTFVKVRQIICDCCGLNRGFLCSFDSTTYRGEGEYQMCPNCSEDFKTLTKQERLTLREFIKLLHKP